MIRIVIIVNVFAEAVNADLSSWTLLCVKELIVSGTYHIDSYGLHGLGQAGVFSIPSSPISSLNGG